MKNYRDSSGVWFELVTIKDSSGNVIQRAYRMCSTKRAKELELQGKAS